MKSLSHVQLFATPWTVACQVPPSMGFSRQKYWSGLPLPSPGGSSQRGDLSRICSSGRGVLDHCACSVASFSASGSLWPYGLYPARLLCPWDSSGKNSGVGCHALLQGIFPIQGSNPHLHRRQILYLLSHWGSARLMVTGTNISISCFHNLVPRPMSFVYLKQKQKHGWLLVMHDILRLRKAEGSFFSFPVYYWSGFPIECHS